MIDQTSCINGSGRIQRNTLYIGTYVCDDSVATRKGLDLYVEAALATTKDGMLQVSAGTHSKILNIALSMKRTIAIAASYT